MTSALLYQTNDHTEPYHVISSNDNTQKIYIDRRVNYKTEQADVEHIFKVIKNNQVKYMILGQHYISLYRKTDNIGIIYNIGYVNPQPFNFDSILNSEYLNVLFNKTSDVYNLMNGKNKQCHTFLLSVPLTKNPHFVCVTSSSSIIPSGKNREVYSTNLMYFNECGDHVLTTTGQGSIIKTADDELILNTISVNYRVVHDNLSGQSNDIRLLIGNLLAQWNNYRHKTKMMHRIEGDIYYSNNLGGIMINRKY